MMTGPSLECLATWDSTVLHSELFWEGHKSTWTLNKEPLLDLLLQMGVKCFKCLEFEATVKPQPKG